MNTHTKTIQYMWLLLVSVFLGVMAGVAKIQQDLYYTKLLLEVQQMEINQGYYEMDKFEFEATYPDPSEHETA